MPIETNTLEDVRKLNLEVPFNENTCKLFYLSEMLGINFKLLLGLYTLFKEDIYGFFYLCSGHKITFPKMDRIASMLKSASNVYRKFSHKVNQTLLTEKDIEIYEKIKALKTDNILKINIDMKKKEKEK